MRTLPFLALAASLAACQGSESNYEAAAAEQQAAANQAQAAAPAPAQAAPAAPQSGSVTTPSGLRVETLTPGAGPRPQMGTPVLVTYEGRLTNGTMFDSSTQPVQMTVGELIPGFNEGLMMMSKGGRYRLHIPAAIGYGAEGAGNGVIPPNADLIFDVTLVDVAQANGAAAR